MSYLFINLQAMLETISRFSNFDGTIIKIITENIDVLKRVYRNIFLGIFRACVTMDF